jgi:hypothetical protein
VPDARDRETRGVPRGASPVRTTRLTILRATTERSYDIPRVRPDVPRRLTLLSASTGRQNGPPLDGGARTQSRSGFQCQAGADLDVLPYGRMRVRSLAVAAVLCACVGACASAPPAPVASSAAARSAAPGLASQQLADVAHAHAAAWGHCYDGWGAAHPGTSGDVDLSIAIARNGQVERTWVAASTFDDDVVSSCLVAVVRQWRFPAADRPTVDQLPFTFTCSVDDPLGPDPGLSRQEISNAIHPQIGAATACYEQALKRRADLAGEVDLSFTITKEGRVGQAGIAGSTLADDAALACLLTALRGWVFPKADRLTSVRRYPFQFRPLGGRKASAP